MDYEILDTATLAINLLIANIQFQFLEIMECSSKLMKKEKEKICGICLQFSLDLF